MLGPGKQQRPRTQLPGGINKGATHAGLRSLGCPRLSARPAGEVTGRAGSRAPSHQPSKPPKGRWKRRVTREDRQSGTERGCGQQHFSQIGPPALGQAVPEGHLTPGETVGLQGSRAARRGPAWPSARPLCTRLAACLPGLTEHLLFSEGFHFTFSPQNTQQLVFSCRRVAFQGEGHVQFLRNPTGPQLQRTLPTVGGAQTCLGASQPDAVSAWGSRRGHGALGVLPGQRPPPQGPAVCSA